MSINLILVRLITRHYGGFDHSNNSVFKVCKIAFNWSQLEIHKLETKTISFPIGEINYHVGNFSSFKNSQLALFIMTKEPIDCKFPNDLKHLRFHNDVKGSLNCLPSTLQDLEGPINRSNNYSGLPDTLLSLKLYSSKKLFQCNRFLPFLQSLVIGRYTDCFQGARIDCKYFPSLQYLDAGNYGIDNYPSTLRYLSVNSINLIYENLPSSLEQLTLRQPREVKNLPPSLQVLKLENFQDSYDTFNIELPPSLIEFSVSGQFNKSFVFLTAEKCPSLKILTIDGKVTQPLHNLPSLTYLRLTMDHSGIAFSSSLLYLEVFVHYPDIILPKSLLFYRYSCYYNQDELHKDKIQDSSGKYVVLNN